MLEYAILLLGGAIIGGLIVYTFFIKTVEIESDVEFEEADEFSRTFLVKNENHELGSAQHYIGFDLFVNKDEVPTRFFATKRDLKVMSNRANKNKDEKQPAV